MLHLVNQLRVSSRASCRQPFTACHPEGWPGQKDDVASVCEEFEPVSYRFLLAEDMVDFELTEISPLHVHNVRSPRRDQPLRDLARLDVLRPLTSQPRRITGTPCNEVAVGNQYQTRCVS